MGNLRIPYNAGRELTIAVAVAVAAAGAGTVAVGCYWCRAASAALATASAAIAPALDAAAAVVGGAAAGTGGGAHVAVVAITAVPQRPPEVAFDVTSSKFLP